MSTTEELKDDGFVEYGELSDMVAKATTRNAKTTAGWLINPLNKLRGVLVQSGEIVLPDDRSWQCLYSQELVTFLAAYLNWHRFGSRRSVVEVVRFYNDFKQGESSALKYVPKKLLKRDTKPGRVGSVPTRSRLELVS